MSIIEMVMRFVSRVAHRHRLLFVLVLALLLCGSAVISATYVATVRADFIEISLGQVSVEVPKSWSHIQGEMRFAEGSAQYVLMTENVTVLRLVVYDLAGTTSHMAELNSTNVSELLNAEALQLTDWYRKNYNQSQVNEIRSGPREISEIDASFLTVVVSGVGNVTMKLTLVGFMHRGLVEVTFASTLECYESEQAIFDHVLDSIRVR